MPRTGKIRKNTYQQSLTTGPEKQWSLQVRTLGYRRPTKYVTKIKGMGLNSLHLTQEKKTKKKKIMEAICTLPRKKLLCQINWGA